MSKVLSFSGFPLFTVSKPPKSRRMTSLFYCLHFDTVFPLSIVNSENAKVTYSRSKST